jgi:tyrosyl-tRNA synthetase
MIGDPSGKSKERVLLDEEVITHNAKQIEKTLTACLSHGKFKVVNNIDWYRNMNVITFLRDIGKIFRVNIMMNKDSVKNRLESNEGMSFTEFSYQLLQGYDFLQLFQQEKCTVQLGGSDQWGNITAGCDLIHKTKHADAYGVTLPLLTTSTGQKIGKSEGISGTIWLSEHKTSAYEFYQHFVRTEDADVIRYLKAFTFLPLEDIRNIEEQHLKNPGDRHAQKVLAEEITKFVHGEEGLKKAKDATSILFGALESPEAIKQLKIADLYSAAFKDVPKVKVPLSKLEEGLDISSLATLISLVPSKGIVLQNYTVN